MTIKCCFYHNLLLKALTVFSFLIHSASSHGYLSSPKSRNFIAYLHSDWNVDVNSRENHHSSSSSLSISPQPEDCPHCLNRGGSKASRCGINNGRNYDTPKSYDGVSRLPFIARAHYTVGQIIDIETTVSAYHGGHYEFKLCVLSNPYEVASQDCFDEYPLEYVEDVLYDAVKDERYPYRAYLAGDYERFVHRLQLPEGVEGMYVLLQWHWLTANSCYYPGYVEYFANNPQLEQGDEPVDQLVECPELSLDGNGVPEQFWNCAEITIVNPSDKGKDKKDKATNKQDKKDNATSKQDKETNKEPQEDIVHFEKDHVQLTKKEKKDKKKNQHVQDVHHHETNHLSETELEMIESNTVIVNASYDATVSKRNDEQRSNNNQFEQALTTRSKPRMLSFVQFKLPKQRINNKNNAQHSIKSAKLKLFALSRIAPKCQIMVKPVRGSFKESMSWGNAPKKTGPQNTQSLSPEKAEARTWITFDITEAVRWNINEMNSFTITLRLSSKSSRLVAYASHDYLNGLYAPQLIMEMGSEVKPSKPVSIQPKPMKPIASSNDSKPKPTPKRTPKPTPKPTPRPQSKPSSNVINYKPNPSNTANKPNPPSSLPKPVPSPSTAAASKTLTLLQKKKSIVTEQLLLYDDPLQGKIQSVYTFDGLMNGLTIMSSKGVAGKTFYLGNNDKTNGSMHGLVNVAAFLAQSMKETIKYNACDENSWDLVDGKYPLSNACGQLGQSYQDYHCAANEKHMECPVDPNMEIKAITHATWYGAPGPLYCKPKSSKNDFTGYWDYQFDCNNPWADPPLTCNDYKGQRAGMYNNTIPVSNSGGRTDVEGCCWWGRGVIQTTGICNFGKLNYYLGARAAKEGRKSTYPDIDFCKNPEAICSSQKYKELKWIAGMFYWMESVQSYNSKGWNYMDQLHAFVDGGLSDPSFINAISGIVNRGCHDPPCGTGEVDGLLERSGYFYTVLSILIS